MADEKRMATFEWLSQNLQTCKKGTPPTTKECSTKSELILNYNIDESLLTDRIDKRLVPREKCVCLSSFTMVIGLLNVNTLDKNNDDSLIIAGGDSSNVETIKILPNSNTNYKTILKLNSDFSLNTSFVDNLTNFEVQKLFCFSNGNIIVNGVTPTGYKTTLLNSNGVILIDDVLSGLSYSKYINCSISTDKKTLCAIIRKSTQDYSMLLTITENGVVNVVSQEILGKPNDSFYFASNGSIILSGGSFTSYNGVTLNSMRTIMLNSSGDIIRQFTEADLIPWVKSDTEVNSLYRTRFTTMTNSETIHMEYYVNKVDSDSFNRNYKIPLFLTKDGKIRNSTSFKITSTDSEDDMTKILPKIAYNTDKITYQETDLQTYFMNDDLNGQDLRMIKFKDTSYHKPTNNGAVTPTSDNIQVGNDIIRVVRVSSPNEVYELGDIKYLGIVKNTI